MKGSNDSARIARSFCNNDNLVFDLAGFNQWEIEGLLQNLVWWNSVDFSSKYAGIEQAMNTAITNTLELWEAATE